MLKICVGPGTCYISGLTRLNPSLDYQEQKKHININFRYWDDIVGTGSQKAGPCQFTGPCVLCGNG